MTRPGTPIGWAFRVWLGAEIFFGLAAVLSVARAPADTATNFAWPIQPVVMAAVLGAFYFAVAPAFVLAVMAKRWEVIRVIVIPAALFTTAELVATILHWDKFSTGTGPFDLWLASYVLPPPIYVAAYVWHQRRAVDPSFDKPLPPRFRLAVVVLGALLTAEATLAFIHPPFLSGSFPWALTPLTTRVLCGFFIAIGTILVSVARENDRDRVWVVGPTLTLLLPAVAFQVVRYWDQVDTGNFRFWTILGYLIALGACGVYLLGGYSRNSLR